MQYSCELLLKYIVPPNFFENKPFNSTELFIKIDFTIVILFKFSKYRADPFALFTILFSKLH
jgi:hypothetical protein